MRGSGALTAGRNSRPGWISMFSRGGDFPPRRDHSGEPQMARGVGNWDIFTGRPFGE
jgi:hypothetical protein